MYRTKIKASALAWAVIVDVLDEKAPTHPDDTVEIEIITELPVVEFSQESLDRYVSVEYLDPHPVSGILTHQLFCYRDPFDPPLREGELVWVATVHKARNRAIVREVDVTPPRRLLGQPRNVSSRL